MLVVVAVETEQFPVAAIERIVIMVVVLMMDRELIQFLAVKLASAVRADPWKEFEGKGSIGLLVRMGGLPCHESLHEVGDSARAYCTPGFGLKHATHGNMDRERNQV